MNRHPAPRARQLLRWLPVAFACWAGAAHAADTIWTGAGSEPYWDIGANWTTTAPTDASTNAWLSGYHTAIRSGDWLADSVQGTGALTVSGGSLTLNGTYASNVGALVLQGGVVRSSGQLLAGVLDWQGGALGYDEYLKPPSQVQAGAALLSGNGQLGINAALVLKGPTWWKPGASALTLRDGAQVRVAAGAWVYDDASAGNHSASGFASGFANEGAYVKAGAGQTVLDVRDFTSTGTLVVQAGRLAVTPGGRVNSSWQISGLVHVDGGELEMQAAGGSMAIGGQVHVDNGSISAHASFLKTNADWTVGAKGKLSLGASDTWFTPEVSLAEGHVDNEGEVLLGGAAVFTLAQGYLRGTGTLTLGAFSGLEWDGDLGLDGNLSLSSYFDNSVGVLRGSVLRYDLAGTGDFESLKLGGTALLDGYVALTFGEDGPQAGTYRLLTAEGGLSGTFIGAAGLGLIDLSLDDPQFPSNARYVVELIYGANYVDAKITERVAGITGITPVPEPGAMALMAAGLALLAAAARKR